MRHFDQALVEACINVSSTQRVEFIMELAHTIGCFILPKYMMKAYEAQVPKTDDDH